MERSGDTGGTWCPKRNIARCSCTEARKNICFLTSHLLFPKPPSLNQLLLLAQQCVYFKFEYNLSISINASMSRDGDPTISSSSDTISDAIIANCDYTDVSS
ncbi:hypothetical protein M5689_013828 [Euphorbia peplus]|nr:hypothetical protein M5689_013828 [Euphorbia peplus]